MVRIVHVKSGGMLCARPKQQVTPCSPYMLANSVYVGISAMATNTRSFWVLFHVAYKLSAHQINAS